MESMRWPFTSISWVNFLTIS